MKTELLILGGGPGGYVAAIRAARLKIKTVLVEKHKIGGVCLNYGCIPTKVLLGKTALLKSIRKGKRFGLKADNVHLDYKKLSAFKNQVVGGLVKGIESTLLSSGVTIVNDEGNFRNPHEIELSSGKLIEFDHAIAASGSRNRDLDTIKCDGDIIIDSTGALALEEIPASMLVIGAGAIGLELGLIFSRLGCKVTVVEMMPEILPGMDEELAGGLRNILQKEGVKIFVETTVKAYEIQDGNASVLLSNKDQELEFEKILLAVGRTPNSECVSDLNIELTANGFIKTENSVDTSIPNIKAIGDISGPPLLAHRASHQGIFAVERLSGKSINNVLPPVPGAVFTEPEFASVGLTKTAADNLGLISQEYVFPLQAVSRARTIAVGEGAFKIVKDKSGKILGVHILAPNAGDLIAEASMAINHGLTVDELAEVIHVHPTLSEGLMEAALMAGGRPIHI